MTANQIAYHNMKEAKRANLAREEENSKHNRATEAEDYRHHVTTEQETYRAATVNEAFNVRKQDEVERAARRAEEQKDRALSETERKNTADITLGQDKLQYQRYIDDQNLGLNFSKLNEEKRKVDEMIKNNQIVNLINAYVADVKNKDVEYKHSDNAAKVAAGILSDSGDWLSDMLGIPKKSSTKGKSSDSGKQSSNNKKTKKKKK